MMSICRDSNRMLKALFLCWIGCAVVAVSAFTFPEPAQEEAPPASTRSRTLTFTVDSNLVVVDVTVRDRKGNLINDLRKEDFRVFEDKLPQEITTFSAENIPIGPSTAAIPQPGDTEAVATKPVPNIVNLDLNPGQAIRREDIAGKRLVVLFFDLSSLGTEDLLRSLDAAREFISKDTGPQDLMAIATYSSALSLVQDLTNDRELLLGIIGNLSPSESGETEAEDTGSTESAEEVFVPDSVQFDIFNTDRRLSALETLAKMYREFPERKSLIYFSSGVTTTGTENNAQIRSTVDNANRSNMSIYTVDSRGLVALPPMGDASQRSSGRGMFSGGGMMGRMNSFSGSQETLTTLSQDTGGRTFTDSNDLSLAMKQVQADTQVYYVIGYLSSNSKQDGKYRKIRVEITRPDLEIKHRPGYFASKSFNQLNKEERDLQLQQAMNVDKPFVSVPLILQADYFRSDDKTTYVPISIELDGDGLVFEDKGANREGKFEFVAQVADGKGKITGVARDSVNLKLPAEKADKIREGGIFYSTGFQLSSGDYTLKFLVRDNITGKLGGFEQPLKVPSFDLNSLTLSSIVLGDQLADTRASDDTPVTREGGVQRFQRMMRYDPLVMGNRKVVPSIGNVFVPRQTVYVYFQAYGATEDPDTKMPCIETDLVLIRDNVKILETTPQYTQEWTKAMSGFPFGAGRGNRGPEGRGPGGMGPEGMGPEGMGRGGMGPGGMDPGGRGGFPGSKLPPGMGENNERKGEVTVAISMPLRNLKQGNYILQVHVRDDIAGVNRFQRVPIVIH
jgi:VWFA-related protein